MRRFFSLLVIFLFVAGFQPCASAAMLASDAGENLIKALQDMGLDDDVEVSLNVRIPIPDQMRGPGTGKQEIIPGLDLWATLLRPKGAKPDEKLPTILISTCYRRENVVLMGARLVPRGYNVLAVDNRGTGSAEGQWGAFFPPEQHDTAYIIDKWIPSQPWSESKVGMYGASYMGIIQFLAAGLVEQDEKTGESTYLKAIFPIVSMSDPYRQIVGHGGMFDEEFITFWLFTTELLAIQFPLIGTDDPEEAFSIWKEHLANIPVTVGWVMDPMHIYYGDFFRDKAAQLYWPEKPQQGWRYVNGEPIPEGDRTIPEKLPAFCVGGWYDIFTTGTLENYQYGLKNQSLGNKALVMGPWTHVSSGMGLDGLLNKQEIVARWFDWKIKGKEDCFMKDFPVLLYVMGEERWRAEKSWPLPPARLKQKTLYLSERKPSKIEGDWFSNLNCLNNYGLTENVSTFDYDETENPVLVHNPPLFHGRRSRSNDRWSAGAQSLEAQISKYEKGIDIDAGEPWGDERSDELGVLTFTTEPLEEDVEVVGPLTLTFWAKSWFPHPLTQQAIDETIALIEQFFRITDGNLLLDQLGKKDIQWVVELNDVFENGRAKNITSGWSSAWHRPYDPQNPTAVDPAYTPFDPFYYINTFDPVNHPDFSPIEPGTTYCYVIELWPTDNIFKKGHCIRLSISASDFPHLLPFLSPSENMIVLDAKHSAWLDFTATTPEGEGVAWKWVRPIKGTILEEFAAANDYLIHQRDPDTPTIPAEDNPQDNPAAADSSSSNGGLCYIASVRI